jgi:hypothetical protein
VCTQVSCVNRTFAHSGTLQYHHLLPRRWSRGEMALELLCRVCSHDSLGEGVSCSASKAFSSPAAIAVKDFLRAGEVAQCRAMA